MICSDLTYKLLVLSKIKGIGAKALKQLASIDNFSTLNFKDLAEEHKVLKKKMEYSDISLAEQEADNDIAEAQKVEARIISILDKEYPTLMADTNDSPTILYVKGNWHTDSNKSIGIIGTREPTKHGTIITERISDYFCENDYSIVSGLAIGCDTIAHERALQNNAHTIAVLSHGLQTIAPKQNEQLAKEILDSGGLILTEYPFGTPVRPFQYVQRDKIQAALSQAIIMIQSGLKGGSLHASRAILKYNRILVTPYPTEQDIINNKSNVEANIVIASYKEDIVKELLFCEDKHLDNIIVLRGKEDYSAIIKQIQLQLEKNISTSKKSLFDY